MVSLLRRRAARVVGGPSASACASVPSSPLARTITSAPRPTHSNSPFSLPLCRPSQVLKSVTENIHCITDLAKEQAKKKKKSEAWRTWLRGGGGGAPGHAKCQGGGSDPPSARPVVLGGGGLTPQGESAVLGGGQCGTQNPPKKSK